MKPFSVVGSFDTETTNIPETRQAFCCLYIFSDIRGCSVAGYEPDMEGERILLLRHEDEALEHVIDVVEWGIAHDVVPVICAYNLMFDLQTLMHSLNDLFPMRANAQSATNAYTIDLLDDEGNALLRFWDTFHLEMGGLAAMGSTCGIAKAKGEWDYSLVRAPGTPLTEREAFYARRDVQVILAYLRYILEANAFIMEADLGFRVLTKTSIVRRMAAVEIGKLTFTNSHGKKVSLAHAHRLLCQQSKPYGYGCYAVRKASFRGGFTFTASRYAHTIQANVASLDVTSMHHAFINGRHIPVSFAPKRPEVLNSFAEQIVAASLDDVLARYHQPFFHCIHACMRFKNLRLRSGSAFEEEGIGLIPESKFTCGTGPSDIGDDERAKAAEGAVRESGYVDRAKGATFAFGKLMAAAECEVHVSEVELWAMAQVYEWDSMEAIYGEATLKQRRAPDYVTLQSNVLYRQKDDMKRLCKEYRGLPFDGEIGESIPENIRELARSGEATESFLSGYYNSTVKGMFNGIYGVNAQDEYKPGYAIDSGILYVDASTKVTRESFKEASKATSRVLYPYGLRIVGGSRMHLVIAIMLLKGRLGDRIRICGGDTDSLKVSTDADVTDAMLLDALSPLHEAVGRALRTCMEPVRRDYSEHAADLSGVGEFEVESHGNGQTRYPLHMEAWNKARLSLEETGAVHVTCAGLSRPHDTYTIVDWFADMLEGHAFEEVAPLALGYNTVIANEVCHALQRTHPLPADRFQGNVIDHLGESHDLDLHEAIGLFDADRDIADTGKRGNRESLEYMARAYGRHVDDSIKSVERGCLKVIGEDGTVREL